MSDSCQRNKHAIRRELLKMRELLDANKARDNSVKIQDRLMGLQEYTKWNDYRKLCSDWNGSRNLEDNASCIS